MRPIDTRAAIDAACRERISRVADGLILALFLATLVAMTLDAL
jgi:hypothetical protein